MPLIYQEAGACDGEILQLKDHQGEISQQLEGRQTNVQHLQSSSDTLDGDIDRLVQVKQKVILVLSLTCFTSLGLSCKLQIASFG